MSATETIRESHEVHELHEIAFGIITPYVDASDSV